MSAKFAKSYANNVLTVTDETHTANINMVGSYTLASFHFASDGSGGTLVTDPPVAAGQSEGVVDLSLPSHGGNAASFSSSRRPGAATGIGDFASVRILGDQSDSLVGPSSDKIPFTFGSSGMAVHDVAFSGISLGQAGPVADRLTGKLADWFSRHNAGGSAGGEHRPPRAGSRAARPVHGVELRNRQRAPRRYAVHRSAA